MQNSKQRTEKSNNNKRMVFICALNAGALSRALSLRIFTMFAVIQMEFYLFHQVVIRVLGPKLTVVSPSVFVQSVMLFFITLAVSVLYERMLKKKVHKGEV